MSSSEDEEKYTPPESLAGKVNNDEEAQLQSLKSKENYELCYKIFKSWRDSRMLPTSEETLQAYFDSLTEKYKPPSLWTQYSMLKKTISINEKIDISLYKGITPFLKKISQGYQGKQSKSFKLEEIREFIENAPDEFYLATKVSLIIGVAGGCVATEMVSIKTTDIEELGQKLLITVTGVKPKGKRTFMITPEYSKVVKQYRELRPKKAETNRFFLNYQKGKCTVQVIGKNKFYTMPRQIAQFLKLKHPDLYSGHAFRQTASTLQRDVRSNILDLLSDTADRTKAKSGEKRIESTSHIQQNSDNNSSFIGFQEVFVPCSIDEEVPGKRPKLEIDFELKDGHDPLENVYQD